MFLVSQQMGAFQVGEEARGFRASNPLKGIVGLSGSLKCICRERYIDTFIDIHDLKPSTLYINISTSIYVYIWVLGLWGSEFWSWVLRPGA